MTIIIRPKVIPGKHLLGIFWLRWGLTRTIQSVLTLSLILHLKIML